MTGAQGRSRAARILCTVATPLAIFCAFLALCIYLFFLELVFSAELYLVAAAAFAVISAACRYRAIERAVGRLWRAGVISFAIDIISLAAIVAVLYLWAANHSKAFDLTVNNRFTLSQATRQILAKLDQPVGIIGFLSEKDPRIGIARDLLFEYRKASRLVSTRLIDPQTHPAEARRLGLKRYGMVLVSCGQRKEWSAVWDERSITGLIRRAVWPARQSIYFLTGHGERSVEGLGRQALSEAAQSLFFESFEVKTVNLLTSRAVPTDASVIVAAAPRLSYLTEELQLLRSYLSAGGRLLILAESYSAHVVNPIVRTLGARVMPLQVIDPARNVWGDARTPAVGRQTSSSIPVVAGLATTCFPGASPIRLRESRPLVLNAHGILRTSLTSYALPPDAKPGTEPIQGPFYLGATIEAPAEALAKLLAGQPTAKTPGQARPTLPADAAPARFSRIVVIGDADFASNGFIDRLGNEQLFVSSIKWLAEKHTIASIPAKPRRPDRLTLTNIELNVIKFVSIILLPLAVLMTGLAVSWKRR